jgi:hypothetical protein
MYLKGVETLQELKAMAGNFDEPKDSKKVLGLR